MLLVETYLAPSTISGIGLFAAQNIKKGEKIWEYLSGFDITISEKDLDKLSSPARKQFLNYCYHSQTNRSYVLCFDDARFMNHSDNPNLIDDNLEQGLVFAARDIAKGEEITTNYKTFDDDYKLKLSGS